MCDVRTYTVVGMTCSHCAASVTDEVRGIPDVDTVRVTLKTGGLYVTSSQPLDDSAVRGPRLRSETT